MMKIQRFEDIKAWQLARELTLQIYRMTKKPRFARDYELKGQIQSAAGSSIKDLYEQTRQTRAAIHGFIKYLKQYEKRKSSNREP